MNTPTLGTMPNPGQTAKASDRLPPSPCPDASASDIQGIAELEQAAKDSKILIVDDEPINIKVAKKFLSGFGYRNFVTSSDSTKAIALILDERPDVVLLDIMMPHVSGLDILAAMQENPAIRHIPVVVLTAVSDAETKLKALDFGATDFLTKPVDPNELAPRIRNVLIVRAHQRHLAAYADKLEEAVQLRTAELAASRAEVIQCLARAADYRDDNTGHHVIRVGRYAALIARGMGFANDRVELIEQAAKLHDVGKIGIPDSILLKPFKLEPSEYELMQKHCGFGRKIIQPIEGLDWEQLRQHPQLGSEILDVRTSPILQLAASIALTHHEKWDGTGYPLGLAGEDIPIEGRITAVADVYDALSSKRPYKPPFPREECFAIIEEGRGTQFDPQILDAFFAQSDEIIKTQISLADVD